jgi:hypothetical protein
MPLPLVPPPYVPFEARWSSKRLERVMVLTDEGNRLQWRCPRCPYTRPRQSQVWGHLSMHKGERHG